MVGVEASTPDGCSVELDDKVKLRVCVSQQRLQNVLRKDDALTPCVTTSPHRRISVPTETRFFFGVALLYGLS
jgi:hypothetical protein